MKYPVGVGQALQVVDPISEGFQAGAHLDVLVGKPKPSNRNDKDIPKNGDPYELNI